MHFFSAVKKAEAFFPGAKLERDDVTFLARRRFPFWTGNTAFENHLSGSHLNCLEWNRRGLSEASLAPQASHQPPKAASVGVFVNETILVIFQTL